MNCRGSSNELGNTEALPGFTSRRAMPHPKCSSREDHKLIAVTKCASYASDEYLQGPERAATW